MWAWPLSAFPLGHLVVPEARRGGGHALFLMRLPQHSEGSQNMKRRIERAFTLVGRLSVCGLLLSSVGCAAKRGGNRFPATPRTVPAERVAYSTGTAGEGSHTRREQDSTPSERPSRLPVTPRASHPPRSSIKPERRVEEPDCRAASNSVREIPVPRPISPAENSKPSGPTLESHRETYEAEVQRIRTGHARKLNDLLDAYAESLGSAIAVLRRAGDPDPVLRAVAEKTRFERERTVPHTPPDDLPSEIHRVQQGYRVAVKTAEVEKGNRFVDLTKKYIAALGRLMKAHTAADRLDLALDVKTEKERVGFILADVEAKVAKMTEADCLLRFRGCDQNHRGIHEKYALQLNDGNVVSFDEKRQAVGEAGERREDWELYEFSLRCSLRPAGQNALRIWLVTRHMKDGAGGALMFDFIELRREKGLMWRIGTEDFSLREFSGRAAVGSNRTHVDRKKRVMSFRIPSGEKEPDPRHFLGHLLDSSYERGCPELVIIF